jgi:hypothetical protein
VRGRGNYNGARTMEGVILIIDLIMGAEEVAEVVLHVVVVMLATSGLITLVQAVAPERHQPLVQLQSEFFCSYASGECIRRSLIFLATIKVHE